MTEQEQIEKDLRDLSVRVTEALEKDEVDLQDLRPTMDLLMYIGLAFLGISDAVTKLDNRISKLESCIGALVGAHRE